MKEKKIVEIDIDKLVIDGCNIRTETYVPCENFDTDIQENGVQNPLLVRPLKNGRFGVVCGSRRFNASIKNGKKTIPCVIEEMDDLTALGQSVRENALRTDVSLADYEKAVGKMYDLLNLPTLAKSKRGRGRPPKQKTGIPKEEIIEQIKAKTGLGRSTIQNAITLHVGLSEDVKELLKNPMERSKELNEKITEFSPNPKMIPSRLTVKDALELTKIPKEKQLESVMKPKPKPTCSTEIVKAEEEDVPAIVHPTKKGMAQAKETQLQTWIDLGKSLGIPNVEFENNKAGMKAVRKFWRSEPISKSQSLTRNIIFCTTLEEPKLEAQVVNPESGYVTTKHGHTTVSVKKHIKVGE